jgi:Tol biopolymer transport system component
VRIPLALFATLLVSVGSGATASTTAPPRNGLIVANGDEGIYLVDSRSGTATLVPNTEDLNEPTWSPDGTLLAVSVWEGETSDVYTLKPDGSERKLVLQNASSPTWSPDGKHLAVVRNACAAPYECVPDDVGSNMLAIVEADGSDVRLVALEGGNDARYVATPQWSPDGRLIAFIDGSGKVRLVSSDGKRAKLSAVATAGTGLSWSPDSTKLAFDRYVETKTEGRWAAVVLDLATAKEKVLRGQQQGAQAPAWSPQGDQLAFISITPAGRTNASTATEADSCGEHSASELWAMSPDGASAHRLAKGPFYGVASWARALETEEAAPTDTATEQQPLPAPPATLLPSSSRFRPHAAKLLLL